MRPIPWLVVALLLLSAAVGSAAEPKAGLNPIEKARREFFDGKLDAAIATLDEAEKSGDTNPRLSDLRGCVLMEQGKFAEAIKFFEAAREADPAAFGRLHVGDALRRQGKWEEARAAYQAGLKETNILITNERLRFAVFMTYLGEKDEEQARQALERLTFPTESPAYYYAQAAWSYAHGEKREGQQWLRRVEDIFPLRSTAWFARHLYEFGWLKPKPPLVAD